MPKALVVPNKMPFPNIGNLINKNRVVRFLMSRPPDLWFC